MDAALFVVGASCKSLFDIEITLSFASCAGAVSASRAVRVPVFGERALLAEDWLEDCPYLLAFPRGRFQEVAVIHQSQSRR